MVKCSRRRAALLYLPRSNTREPPVEPPGAQTTDAYTREQEEIRILLLL
jgi:hypothetical protein